MADDSGRAPECAGGMIRRFIAPARHARDAVPAKSCSCCPSTTLDAFRSPRDSQHPHHNHALDVPDSATSIAGTMPPLIARTALELMLQRDEARLNRQLDRFERQLPRRVGRSLRWLREPSSRWVRIPSGLLLIVGGIFSILPVLGLWMLPLGLLLLAQDLPFLRRPMRRTLLWVERRWVRWIRRRRAR
ncbi:MAG TPA: hypothetical protein VIL60_04500 [Rhodanobacter sp.]